MENEVIPADFARDPQLRRLLLYPAELRGQDSITKERLVPTQDVGSAFWNPASERNLKTGDSENGSNSLRNTRRPFSKRLLLPARLTVVRRSGGYPAELRGR